MNGNGNEPLAATPAEEFGAAVEVIELPVKQGGKVMRMEIAAVEVEALIPFLKGIVPAGRDEDGEAGEAATPTSLDSVLNTAESLERQARGFAAMGAFVSPAIAFDGPEPGKLEWRKLHFRNRAHVISEIAMLSGQGPGRADTLATFPAVDRAGRPDGDAARAGDTAGAAAE